MSVEAIQHIRRMRGGAQSHLMRCSDGNLYVVKFQNNPQHPRILANEMLATKLASHIGLPVPDAAIVEVDPWLIEHTSDLTIQLAHHSFKCSPGLQFGSRYPLAAGSDGQVFDYFPAESLVRVQNACTFAGMLAFDKWTGNGDGRQACFYRKGFDRKYTAMFIDQGYCFNAGAWNFPNGRNLGIYPHMEVYGFVTGWNSFEPWLSRIENLNLQTISEIAADIPQEWYGSRHDALSALTSQLFTRRTMVRSLIMDFGQSSRTPFSNWVDLKKAAYA